jgi:anti-sigma factor RsiW
MTADRAPGTPGAPPPEMDEDLLSAYIDGELDAATRDAVETRLAASPEWRAVLAEVREARDAVRGLPVRDAPPGFWDGILRERSDAPAAVVDLDAARLHRRPRTARWAAIGAAAAAAAIVAVAVIPGESKVRPAVATFTDAHAVRSSVDGDAVSNLAGVTVPGGPTR